MKGFVEGGVQTIPFDNEQSFCLLRWSELCLFLLLFIFIHQTYHLLYCNCFLMTCCPLVSRHAAQQWILQKLDLPILQEWILWEAPLSFQTCCWAIKLLCSATYCKRWSNIRYFLYMWTQRGLSWVFRLAFGWFSIRHELWLCSLELCSHFIFSVLFHWWNPHSYQSYCLNFWTLLCASVHILTHLAHF